jgi:Tfp pilus assembly protein PilO
MEKFFKNLHWMIIAVAAFNFFNLYTASDEQYTSLVERQETQRADLIKNKKSQREIKNYYENIKEEKEKIERVAREIEKTQQLLPSEISDTENISLLRKLADDVNIKELSVRPDSNEDDRGFYFARKYNLKAKATYLQFLIMFEKIAENKRILNVGRSKFKKLEQIQRGKFQLIDGEFTIEAYRYNSNFKEDRGIDEIEEQFDSKKPQTKPKKIKNSDSGTEV